MVRLFQIAAALTVGQFLYTKLEATLAVVNSALAVL